MVFVGCDLMSAVFFWAGLAGRKGVNLGDRDALFCGSLTVGLGSEGSLVRVWRAMRR